MLKRYYKPSGHLQQADDRAAELHRLRAELKRVKMERDILKDSAVYFSEESKKSTRS